MRRFNDYWSSHRLRTRSRWPARPIIRVRLTLWYVLVLAGVLISFSALLYLILDQALDDQVDAHLRLSAEQALGALSFNADQLQVLQTEGESEITPLAEQGLLVRVLQIDGRVVASAGPFHTLPLPAAELAAARQGQARFTQVDAPGGSTPVRLYITPYTITNRVYGVVVLGQSLQPNQDTLQQLLLILAVVVPLTLAAASAGGLFLANRALQPIDRLTRAAGVISAQDLSQRLNLDLPDDEVGRLAQTFDRMLARLDEAFQRQRQFTADASHELRTPLAIMKGQIGVALNRSRAPSEYQSVLTDLEEEVDRLTRLADDLLLLARADDHLRALQREQVDLGILLPLLADQVYPLAAAKTLTLDVQVPTDLCVLGDPDKLLRLFLNLLDNAVKYTPAHGRLILRATSGRPDQVVVEVADSGPAIPPDQLAHIFERFHRTDAARSRATGGWGLGLPIAQSIAAAHGGAITVQSDSGGNVFTVHLPQDTSSVLCLS